MVYDDGLWCYLIVIALCVIVFEAFNDFKHQWSRFEPLKHDATLNYLVMFDCLVTVRKTDFKHHSEASLHHTVFEALKTCESPSENGCTSGSMRWDMNLFSSGWFSSIYWQLFGESHGKPRLGCLCYFIEIQVQVYQCWISIMAKDAGNRSITNLGHKVVVPFAGLFSPRDQNQVFGQSWLESLQTYLETNKIRS